MRRIPIQMLVLPLLGSIGCVSDLDFGGQRFKVTGMAMQLSGPPTPSFECCDFDEISLRGDSLVRAIDLDDQDVIETERIVRLRATQFKSGVFFNYGVLMGPNPDSSESVLGWFENSDPTPRLASDGWVYAEGVEPQTKSDWVSAAAEGSAIVLQRVSSSLQRFYFLDGSQATVTCNADTDLFTTMNTVGRFIEIGPGCAFGPETVIAGSAVEPFIDHVTAAANACDLSS